MNRARRRTVLRASGYRLTQGPGGFTSVRDAGRRVRGSGGAGGRQP